mgnify:CR=1 FL=1
MGLSQVAYRYTVYDYLSEEIMKRRDVRYLSFRAYNLLFEVCSWAVTRTYQLCLNNGTTPERFTLDAEPFLDIVGRFMEEGVEGSAQIEVSCRRCVEPSCDETQMRSLGLPPKSDLYLGGIKIEGKVSVFLKKSSVFINRSFAVCMVCPFRKYVIQDIYFLFVQEMRDWLSEWNPSPLAEESAEEISEMLASRVKEMSMPNLLELDISYLVLVENSKNACQVLVKLLMEFHEESPYALELSRVTGLEPKILYSVAIQEEYVGSYQEGFAKREGILRCGAVSS